MRCFLAVDPPEAVREAIAAVQGRLGTEVDGVRWVVAENLHLTLRFLGEIDEARAAAVVAATERVAAAHGPIDVEAAGLGVFPGPVRPRVVWVGLGSSEPAAISGSAAVGRLARAVEQALVPAGFPLESRPFRAHLTIGRSKHRDGHSGRGASALIDALAAAGSPRFGAWTLRDVVLFRSHLGPRGPRYEALRRFPLAGAMAP